MANRPLRWKRLGLALLAALGLSAARAEPVVFAAASTRAALSAAIAECGCGGVVSYGASGTIARQIAQGAPADIFLSANPRWMAHLVDAGLIDAQTVQVLASNRLVLIAPQGHAETALTAADLTRALDGGFFAVADPDIAPVGQYGRAALQALDLWAAVEPSLLPTRNTIATVAAVRSGAAALGLVYRSDTIGADGVTVAAAIPADSHPAVQYLIAPVAQGRDPGAAAELLSCLVGPAGQARFAAFGFAPARGDGS
ncbi:molybdate ABC transporter substrate-binding protein [Actibacterium ureilyticum]|uniref:molybdate ABC transporter substrate-binding protein n=1 Tax=Actibacterium ureilyticum TaxID=1590614 RepID=UPI000BAA9E8F|nr:molybdate ABC transporter substrate-binding protein [Actibacterium ureilyticum]